MTSINKSFYEHGFCEVDGNNVTIEISYLSMPKVTHSEKQQFVKMRNMCWYLKEGKCNLGNKCPIYLKAKAIIDDIK